jgi:3-hydroxyisobutyrate dehydrogenase
MSSISYDPSIGIVGAGGVGEAIGLNLARAGKRVVSFCDHNPHAGHGLAGLGAERFDTPREVAEKADVVITALTIPPVVKDCVLGDDGVLSGLRQGGLWIDHSTTDYNQTKDLAEIAVGNGQQVLEAPITGGLTLLQEGKMTVLVGGDRAVYDEHKDLLDPSFATVLYMGEMGTATITKVVTNMFAGAHVVLTAEALMIAKKAGIDMSAYFDAVRVSAGNSYVWETEAPLIMNQTFDPGFHIDLHCKDLNMGYEIGRKYGVPLEMFGLTEQTYLKAMYKYGGTVGSTSPAKLIQDELGVKLDWPGYENWSYTTELIPSENPARVPGMAVVHQDDEHKAKNTKLDARSVDR